MSISNSRILIVDDDADIRLFVEFGLKKSGYVLHQAANGAQALEILKQEKPDLMIADVMMPVLDGYGLMAAVRGDPDLCRLPVIMLTGLDSEKMADHVFQPDAYLKKPFATAELLALVKKLLPK
jgi:two-component system, OmpR family, alkaline phosphatase synthesis response regulator PhoP